MKVLLFLLSLAALPAYAQSLPDETGQAGGALPAGSATDQVARLVGAELQAALGQPFVVENKAGAQGAIAAAEVAKAAPDGYTLMVTTNTPQAANVSLFKKLHYDPVKDFAPITRFGTTSFMLMVRPDFPAKSSRSSSPTAQASPASSPPATARRARRSRWRCSRRSASSTSSKCPTRAFRRPSPTRWAGRSLSPSSTSPTRRPAEGRQAARPRGDLGEAQLPRARHSRDRRGAPRLRNHRLVRAGGAREDARAGGEPPERRADEDARPGGREGKVRHRRHRRRADGSAGVRPLHPVRGRRTGRSW